MSLFDLEKREWDKPFWMPMCAKCRKVVDEVQLERGDMSPLGRAITRLKILCHGEVEESVIGIWAAFEIQTYHNRLPDAFVPKSADMVKAKEGWVV